MEVMTTRFGAIDVDESRIIEMQGEGILGFERLRKFIIRSQDDKTPFLWLQSVEDGAVAFVIIHSFVVKPDYVPVLCDEDITLLDLAVPEDAVLLSIVSIRSNPFQVTANLKAPIVINARNKRAKQVVVDEPDYPVRYDLVLRGGISEASLAETAQAQARKII
jgi:flagellar assembly factor FliW